MRRLRVAAQVRIDLVATFSPTGATRHQAYNAVRGTDPVIGGPRSSAGGRGQPAHTSFPTDGRSDLSRCGSRPVRRLQILINIAPGVDNRAAILDVATCINAEEPMHYRLNSNTVIARNIEIETGKPSSTRQTMLN
jgi:hypothetical protein